MFHTTVVVEVGGSSSRSTVHNGWGATTSKVWVRGEIKIKTLTQQYGSHHQQKKNARSTPTAKNNNTGVYMIQCTYVYTRWYGTVDPIIAFRKPTRTHLPTHIKTMVIHINRGKPAQQPPSPSRLHGGQRGSFLS